MNEKKLIQQGKALVMAIQGLQALETAEVELNTVESNLCPQLVRSFQRQLRVLLAEVSPEANGEILAAIALANLTIRPGALN